ncbi:unnamed protein product [Didymodactylos carnosus]|uniref:Carboxypeptidase n=1 Tax=Didymodactylos carnosus TaxID=1234261 RepID=A0A815A9N7_9BILA|nr:unnamed protein product [Didymodactylos carnosus]CAF1251812.1 unnamed protein product [Didymodactylos carnosus]CAF3727829.1 unnamed protein product [Didymodactylos carnosus]CAF4021687.1 unnamed protein product [Didymodactylos carnosus]
MLPKTKPAVLDQFADPGEPLFLTPYLEAGNIDQARKLSNVEMPPYKFQSFSGFLTVNKTSNSNLFFWFFQAQSKDVSAPVVVWLQGGPGSSSLFGLFTENGPIMVDKSGMLQQQPFTWNSKYHLLYFDQPVGTGFSFTTDDMAYVRNEDEVARDLYNALIQFFQIYYEYAPSPFYVTGESYGGKYVPAITYKIHLENPQAKVKINLKGMAVGDGLIDPFNQWDYGPVLFQLGLIDQRQLSYVNLQAALARYYIEQKNFTAAHIIFDNFFDYYSNATGLNDIYNYLLTEQPEDLGYYVPFITSEDHRRQIHVGNLTYNNGQKVYDALSDDMMQSIVGKVTVIANNYKVMIYNGLLDIIIASSVTMNWVDKFQWDYSDDLRNADRIIWKVDPSDQEVAGYIKRAHQFYLATIRNAGHMVPHDQPRAAFDLIDRFINDKNFAI